MKNFQDGDQIIKLYQIVENIPLIYNVSRQNNDTLRLYLEERLNYSIQNNFISQEIGSFINEYTFNGYSYNEILTNVDSLINSGRYGGQDLEALQVFKEVLIASHELWQNSDQQRPVFDCTDEVIAYDAAGAVLGLFGGPVWSIVQGALVSIAKNQDCKYNIRKGKFSPFLFYFCKNEKYE